MVKELMHDPIFLQKSRNGDEMNILIKDELNKKLYEYYIEHYGQMDNDKCFESLAVNV